MDVIYNHTELEKALMKNHVMLKFYQHHKNTNDCIYTVYVTNITIV